jgi:hypothetical protein
MTDTADNNARPDVPRVGLFNRFDDAVAEASFRASLTRRRYRVRFEPNNRWWQITMAWPNTRVIPPEVTEEATP